METQSSELFQKRICLKMSWELCSLAPSSPLSFLESQILIRWAAEISAVNVAKRQYQKEYMEYWNSTVALTGTGRPVDAIISPLAPFAAARPDMYKYYGTLCWMPSNDFAGPILVVERAS